MVLRGRVQREANHVSPRNTNVLNDVSIQADLQSTEPTAYESEDERMGRRKESGGGGGPGTLAGTGGGHRLRRSTNTYSKQDIREQYCINDRQLLGLEDSHPGLFGCLSSYQVPNILEDDLTYWRSNDSIPWDHLDMDPITQFSSLRKGLKFWKDSSCSSRSPSLLTVCVKRRVPSDENLAELVRGRPGGGGGGPGGGVGAPSDWGGGAPFPRWVPPPYPPYPLPPPPALLRHHPYYHHDPYAWLPDDDEPCRMEPPTSPTSLLSFMADCEDYCSQERSRALRDFDSTAPGSGGGGYPLLPPPPRRYLSYSSEYLTGGSRHHLHHHPPHTGGAHPHPPHTGGGSHHHELPPPCPAHHHLPPPPPPPQIPSAPVHHRPKHVSFARSHTLQSFDDSVSFGSGGSGVTSCSQERLIDGKKAPETLKVVVLEKAKRAPMKTQATQTEVCLGRKPLPPNYLSLSPRTVQRVRMVSQGAQTNGDKSSTRKLMKSYSEAGKIGAGGGQMPASQQAEATLHEPLQRTQSEEPRSPFLPTSPKEIFINFEPLEKKGRKRLAKTLSEGEILETGKTKEEGPPTTQSDGELQKSGLTTTSLPEPASAAAVPPPQLAPPLKHLVSADSTEEEFHENLIYGDMMFRGTEPGPGAGAAGGASPGGGGAGTPGPAPPPPQQQPTKTGLLTPSPFASCDSLNTRDHSADSMWNESQMTVLHGDSDNNGTGTGLSGGSDLSTSLGPPPPLSSGAPAGSSLSAPALTPSSRRKHLLMLQHAQRSSMDTEALEVEELETEQTQEPVQSTRVRQEKSPSVPTLAVTLPTSDVTLEPSTQRPILKSDRDLKAERPISPGLRGKKRSPGTRTPESEPHHSSSATLSSNEAFARSDSGRTNTTDMSEASTTDDYTTAPENNSDTGGTAAAAGRQMMSEQQSGTATASFESGSSLYSFTRTDLVPSSTTLEEQQVPSSPPLIEEEEEKASEEKGREADGDTSSPESSSCGSYSVEGSSDKVGHSDKSGHCSSAGGYDSPFEDQRKSKWSEDKSKAKKRFTLELSANVEQADESPVKSGRSPWPVPKKSGVTPTEAEKVRARSPVPLPGKKTPQQTTPSSGRSPGETVRKEDWPAPTLTRHTPEEKRSKISNGLSGLVPLSSDESSEECTCGKNKRTREAARRKTPPIKSPTIHGRRKSMPLTEETSKRHCSIPGKSPSPQEEPTTSAALGSRLSPYSVRSPAGSPSRLQRLKGATSPDSARLKALSAESLRSVSPGSDSVFYSEPSSNATGVGGGGGGEPAGGTGASTPATGASAGTSSSQPPAAAAGGSSSAPSGGPLHHQPTCSHCGMQFDSVQPPKTTTGGGEGKAGETIVQPPAGFEDSPRTPHRTRLYKKAEKRYRSEERRQRMHAEAARAKSEERAREERKDKVRPLTRSTDASMEKLHSQSSPEEEDEWSGVLSEAYNTAIWVYISSTEEQQFWSRPQHFKISNGEEESEETVRLRRDSTDSTQSENEFRRKYQAVAHRMVHRKSSLEMYKRLASKSFESDKRVLVRRVSGDFGFRIHGSKPIVVSAIESGTPAESSGLEVGDIIISVNNTNVLDASHSEVVKLAHTGSDTLELEVVRTSDKVGVKAGGGSPPLLRSGWLYRLSSTSTRGKSVWVLRFFVLKEDHCLYHYKTDQVGQPLGALRLTDYTLTQTPDSERPHSFRVTRKGCPGLHLAAVSSSEAGHWMAALSQACQPQSFFWMSEKCLKAPPTKIPEPDCVGTLSMLVHHRGKTWRRRFCILKDASLYFYTDINAEKAIGMVCLHGYRVQSLTSASRRFSFELFPPEPSLLHFYFYTDTELDKKRWLAALEYSIDRWVKVA